MIEVCMIQLRFLMACVTLLVFAAWVTAQTNPASPSPFELHNGDVVVFYGDSITEQRLYTTYIEEYVLTRYPQWKVHFVNSGVGGDQVSGGVGGPIDLRLERDVYAYHPSVITIMLGMNDGYLGPLEPGIFTSYSNGYRHIVDALQANLPQAKLLLIKPSPFDEVTRAAEFTPGYNSTLLRFGEFVGHLAQEKHSLCADLNAPVIAVLTKAKDLDPSLSHALIPDRVHPGSGVHWIMAEAILKAWNVGAIVTAVVLDVKATDVQTVNTEVSQIRKTKYGLSWVQADRALPRPLPSAETDPFADLSARTSDLNEALNQQNLRVVGLAQGEYELQIDELKVGRFDAGELDKGINIALLDTPMLSQARMVALDTEERNGIESTRYTIVHEDRTPTARETIKRLNAALANAMRRQWKDAQPLTHRYLLSSTSIAAGK
jgi:lysophospholipase L1-like esterase